MALEGVGVFLVVKSYFVATLLGILGAIAHAIQAVKKQGWKGWLSFIGDVAVCIFFGQVFYHIGILWSPEYAIVLTSLGSFWGAKSFDFIKEYILKSLQANLPK